jgi:hypothetical protein
MLYVCLACGCTVAIGRFVIALFGTKLGQIDPSGSTATPLIVHIPLLKLAQSPWVGNPCRVE